MKKHLKITKKSYKPMAIATLFCAAAGAYATNDGWKYQDPEKTVIENAGTGSEPRIRPLEKGRVFDSGEEIQSVSNVKVKDKVNAKFVYETVANDNNKQLNAVVLDGESQNVKIGREATLDVDATSIIKEGVLVEGVVTDKSTTAVVFSNDATSASLTGAGDLKAKADVNAVAVESTGDAKVDISLNSISAEATKGDATAIDVKNAGDITVNTLLATSAQGVATALKVGTATGDITVGTATGNITVGDIAQDKTVKVTKASGTVSVAGAGNLTVGEAEKIELEGGSLGGKLTVTNYAKDIDVTSLGAADVKLQGTEFNATEVKGDAKFNGTGNVTIGTAGSVTVADGDTLDGTLGITASVGDVAIDTITGDATIKSATGDVVINTSNSAVKIDDVQKTATIGSSTSVEATMASGSSLDAGDTTDLTAKVAEGATNISVKANSATNVDIQTLGGTTTIDGQKIEYQGDVYGGINSLTAGGSVKLDIVDKLTVSNRTQADISINSTKTSATVDSLTGNLVINKASISGVTVTNNTGDVTVGLDSANLNASNITGNVVAGGKGDVNVDTVSGTVKTSGDLDGKLTASNVTGEIDATAGVLGSADLTLNNNDFKAGDITADAQLAGTGNTEIANAGSVTVADGDTLTGNLNITNSVGKVDISTIDGNATINTAGEVVIDNGKDVTITTANGAVDLRAVENVTVTTAKDTVAIDNGGNVSITDAQKDVTVGTVGAVEIAGAGNLNVTTSAGKVTATDNLGGINVSNEAGNATVAGIVAKEFLDYGTGEFRQAELGNVTVDKSTDDIVLGKAQAVSVKDATNVSIKDAAGTVNVDKASGDITIANAQQNVTVGNVGNVSYAGAGNLTVTEQAGVIKATGNIADINAENATIAGIDAKDRIDFINGTIEQIEVGNVTVKESTGGIALGKAQEVKIDKGTNVSIADAQKDVTLGNVADVSIAGAGNLTVTEQAGVITASGKLGNINATNEAGTVTIAGINAKETIDIFAGEIKPVEVGSVTVDKSTGDIALGTAQDVVVKEGADVEVVNAQGNVTLGTDSTTVANVKVDSIAADKTVTVNAATGNVTVDGEGSLKASNVDGVIKSTTSIGSADVALKDGKTFEANVVVGEAKVTGSAGASATIAEAGSLDATGTTNGNLVVTNDKAVSLTGGDLVLDVTKVGEEGINLGDVDSVSITDGNNNIKIGDVAGNVVVEQGDPDAGGTKGDISVEKVTGEIAVNGLQGKLDITEAESSVGIDNIAGSVTIGTAKSDVKVENSTGNLTIENAQGNITSTTTVGDIDVTFTNASNLDINNANLVKVELAGGTLTQTGTIAKAELGGFGDVTLTVESVNMQGNVANDYKITSDATNGGTIETTNVDSTVGLKVNVTATKGDFVVEDANTLVVEGDLTGSINASNVVTSVSTNSVTGKVELGGTASLDVSADSTLEGGLVVNDNGLGNINASEATIAGIVATGTVGDVTVKNTTDVVDIANAGNVKIETADKSVSVDNGGNVTVTTAKDTVAIDNGGNVSITDAQKDVTVGTVGAVEIAGAGNLNVTTSAGKVTTSDLGNINASEATIAGIVATGTVGDVTVKNTTDVVDIANAGNVKIETADKSVSVDNGGNVTVTTAKDLVDLGTVGEVIVESGKNVEVDTANGKIDLGTVENATVTTANSTVKVENANSVTIETANALVDLGNVTEATISTAKGEVKIVEVEKLNVTLADTASLNVNDVLKEATIAGTGLAVVENVADDAVITSSNADTTINNIGNNADVTVDGGNVTVKSAEGADNNNVVLKGGTSIWESIKNKLTVWVDASSVEDKVEVQSAKEVEVYSLKQGSVVVQNTELLTINTKGDEALQNDSETNLITKSDVQTTLENAGNTDVVIEGNLDSVSLDGTSVKSLAINGAITEGGSIDNFTVENGLTVETTKAELVLGENSFKGDATINDAQATVKAGNIDGTLTIGSSNNSELVLKGELNDINVNSNIALGSEGKDAVVAGNINAGANDITVNASGKDISFKNPTSSTITAGSLKGDGATGLVDSLLNSKYEFDKNATGENTLIGTHDDDSITATLDTSKKTVEHEYITVKYDNKGSDTSKVSFEIKENTYLEDVVAKTENEKQLAKVYDNLKYNANGSNAEAVQLKEDFIKNANSGTLGAVMPQSVVHSIRMNMDLADIVHLDTLNRTSATRDMLNAIARKRLMKKGRANEILQGETTVSVRSINRFSSYSGDERMDGSEDFIYGGLANVEYIASKELFAGFGVGGFNAKSNGKDNCGDSETQSVVLNAYVDYSFYENFDWYLGVTYAFGMNDAERRDISGNEIKSDWNSHMINAFTGVRYSWKPYFNKEFYVKPIIGLNATLLMNPDIDEENADSSELMRINSDDYTSIKSVIGVEASYALDKFYFYGKMFYTHEFGDDSYSLNSSFMNLNSAATMLRTKGWKMGRDAGIFGVGTGYNIDAHWRVYLDYAAEVSSDVSHNFNLGASYRF